MVSKTVNSSSGFKCEGQQGALEGIGENKRNKMQKNTLNNNLPKYDLINQIELPCVV